MKIILSHTLDIIAVWLAAVFITTTPIAVFEFITPMSGMTFALAYAGSFFILTLAVSVVGFGLSQIVLEIGGFSLFLSVIYLSLCHWFDPVALANICTTVAIVLVGLVCLAVVIRDIKYHREQQKQGGASWN